MAKASGITKKLPLSNEMAEFMGKDTASRGEIVKEIWKYIKKEGLNEGRIIHPDDVLEPILGSKSIDMFKMAGKISEHVG
jgi:upstream activation factor subunit UAF30